MSAKALAWPIVAGASGIAIFQAGPGIMGIGPVRKAFFSALSGLGVTDHVALTFDDGPDRIATPMFLEALRARGVRATFFVLGSQMSAAPGLVAEIAAAGHEIAVHGWDHRYLPLRGPRATYDDLASTRDLIAATTGEAPWLYRPPFGVPSTAALLAARKLGLTPVLWSCWGREWTANASPESVFATLCLGLEGGATALLHDSDCMAPAGSWRSALGALPLFLDECELRGLRVGTLGEHGPRWAAVDPRQPGHELADD